MQLSNILFANQPVTPTTSLDSTYLFIEPPFLDDESDVAQRKARKGRNPQTCAEIKIKAKKVPRFVPGKALKDAVS